MFVVDDQYPRHDLDSIKYTADETDRNSVHHIAIMPAVNGLSRVALRLLLVVSVLYGTGAHWAALQGVAWAGMLATRVNELSWADAAKSTFSGKKPCHVCKIIAKGSTSDKTETFLRSGLSLEFAYSVFAHSQFELSVITAFVAPSSACSRLSARPAVPPPKTFLPA